MGKNPSLKPEKRAQIVLLKEEGYSEREISQKLVCSKTAVHQALVKFQASGQYCDDSRSGRPRKTTPRDDHAIRRIAVRSPMSSTSKIRSALLSKGTNISTKTVSRRLVYDFGLKSCKPARKPRLTAKMKSKRLDFARQHISWTKEQWCRVLFSDESTIEQFTARKRNVWRPPGTRFCARYTQQTMKHPPSVMIWGAISAKGTAGLYFLPHGTTMNGQKYLELLKNKLEPHMTVHDCNIFMQDGAPCHRAKIVKEYLKTMDIRILDWPGNSPDLNPIENLWVKLKDKVAEKQPSSASELENAIKHVWINELGPEYCRNLIESMPRRLAATIQNHGDHTKY